MILPCFSHSIERNILLMNKISLSVKSTFCHEYIGMRIEFHFLGKWMQHNNGTCHQSTHNAFCRDFSHLLVWFLP
ncbi:MAG: hypothetical protein C5S48_06630 [Candidatus Methanogaster sp.]|nr:MAG: hypothetical protein C5S48_06630 [ANME-2 cluster archaeon]